MSRRLVLPALAAVLACGGARPPEPPPPAPVSVAAPASPAGPAVAPAEAPRAATPIADQYRDQAARIIAAALEDEGAWKKLEYLTDRIGHRLSGSAALDRATRWAAQAMTADGHANVSRQKVMVPHWVRGTERAAIVAPGRHELTILGLGGSVGTPRRGITAEVVPVASFEQLAELGSEVKGKIVLYTHAMPPYNPETGSGYGDAVQFRGRGASRAGELGAVAALVRSLTATSLNTPHTGATRYEEGKRKIPTAAITIEGAELIERLTAAGESVQIKLEMGARTLPDAVSHNVLAEIVGAEKPEEVVVIGAHIDSWDVGQGAHDDGAGCAIMMQALTIIRKLDLKPRRTIRVVLFTNEENGLRGATAYAAAQDATRMQQHVMAMEADSGGFAPRGFGVEGDERALARMADIVTLLEPVGASHAEAGHGGADVSPLAEAGVPALGLSVDGSRYFDYHHTPADTLDKVDPAQLVKSVAAVAVVAYVIADMPDRLGAE